MGSDKHVVTCSPLQCHAGLPGGTGGEEPAASTGDVGHDPWVGKAPWRRAGQPPPGSLLGEACGQRSLGGDSPQGRKESDATEQLHVHAPRLRSACPPLSASLATIIFPLCLHSVVFQNMTQLDSNTMCPLPVGCSHLVISIYCSGGFSWLSSSLLFQLNSVQSLGRVRLFATP